MNNLVVGDTSQLSYFFPKEYKRISSRNINFKIIRKENYDRIFLLFAEQRTFLNESEDFFLKINFDYTLHVINQLKDICNHIVIYSTSELWNKYDRCVTLNDDFKYDHSPYIKSKEVLCNYINQNRKAYSNVIIIYPFNFNSVYRKEGFLFSKIFDSLINNKKITIGDVNFYRDLTHPKIVVNHSIKTTVDCIVGSGILINVKTFIDDLFDKLNKNVGEYIEFDSSNNLQIKRGCYYSCDKTTTYDELVKLTIEDIYEYKIS